MLLCIRGEWNNEGILGSRARKRRFIDGDVARESRSGLQRIDTCHPLLTAHIDSPTLDVPNGSDWNILVQQVIPSGVVVISILDYKDLVQQLAALPCAADTIIRPLGKYVSRAQVRLKSSEGPDYG